MCQEHHTDSNKQGIWKLFNPTLLYCLAVCLGIFFGLVQVDAVTTVASVSSEIFINLLKLVSLPIIFLSIVSTASSMENIGEVKLIGKKTVKYTLMTTIIAAAVALSLYVIIDPVNVQLDKSNNVEILQGQKGYLNYLIGVIPSNVVKPFSDNNVIGVLILAMLLSVAIINLPKDKRSVLYAFFSSLYAAIMKITSWIILLMPLAVWAFILLFIKDLKNGMEFQSIALYLLCVVLANLIQGIIVLPALLKAKGISPVQAVKGMMPALSVAFFSKSSSATLPMAVKCAQERLNVSPKIAGFTLPLCTTINMNGCAAFILTTVLFVSMSNGILFSPFEMFLWIFISTLAAVGNAGVPMGCFFLSSAFLAAMNVPLNILGVILPFYTLIDMLETAINVWSDASVALVVDKELKESVTTTYEQQATVS